MHFSDSCYYANQFLFQGQMKFYENQDIQMPERNLFVGIITKLRMLRDHILCAQMPVNQKDGVKWMNLLFQNIDNIDHVVKLLQPIRGQDNSMNYKTAAFLTGKEFSYHGYIQSNVLRFYKS